MAALHTDVGSNCVGCRLYPEEYVPQHDAAVDGFEDGYAASARAAVAYAAEESHFAVEPDRELDPGRADVVRYSQYRVSEDEGTDYASAEEAVEEQTTN